MSINAKDLKIEMWTGGVGTKPSVRVTHIPSGFYGDSDETHSRQKNKEKALGILTEKLKAKGRHA